MSRSNSNSGSQEQQQQYQQREWMMLEGKILGSMFFQEKVLRKEGK